VAKVEGEMKIDCSPNYVRDGSGRYSDWVAVVDGHIATGPTAYEAVAQAVRLAVIEECALACEKKATDLGADKHYWDVAFGECASAIRLLKEKKETP
jgi:hypothetical protein